MARDFIDRMRLVLDKHPKPWHIADAHKHDGGCSWVCDANGNEVIGASEWLNIDFDLMQLIVDMFNRTRIPLTE